METPRQPRYPLHGRAKLALSSERMLAGRTIDVGEGGVCLLLEEQIPIGTTCPLCFDAFVNGKSHVITALARSVYSIFASHGGFRVGFQFVRQDPQRTLLIKSLGGKKPKVEPDIPASDKKHVQASEDPSSPTK